VAWKREHGDDEVRRSVQEEAGYAQTLKVTLMLLNIVAILGVLTGISVGVYFFACDLPMLCCFLVLSGALIWVFTKSYTLLLSMLATITAHNQEMCAILQRLEEVEALQEKHLRDVAANVAQQLILLHAVHDKLNVNKQDQAETQTQAEQA